MKISELKNKLWFNIFIRIAVIFLVFVIVLSVSNVAFLVNFFISKEKISLKEQILRVSEINFSNSAEVINTLTEINEKYNFDVEIYNSFGAIEYTTHGGQMMDFFNQNNDRFSMSHEEMTVLSSEQLSDGIVFETVIRRFDKNEFLLCRKQLSDNLFAEIRVQKQLIANSAAIANEFIMIISLICFALSIIWVLIFARKFSRPIANMNKITKDMAELNFERKLTVKGTDEIAQLATSVNNLSASLSSALKNLQSTNKKLKNEIELERQLDVMRRGFVANVSHELKTPISIISGYAEGLKLDVNPKSREEYCNTIIDESRRMNKLVLNILELSRYESGQIPLNKEVFDISALTSDMLARIFKDKTVEVLCEIPPDTLCFADAMQIEQVLKSLLENAAAHVSEGGKVTVNSTETNQKLKISVFNTGEKIDDDLMPQIWASFFRGEKSHKRESSRFGLGLSIVAAVMKMHGNNCGVYNTEDGVCFWFETDLPTA